MIKNAPANEEDAGNMGSVPGWGRSPLEEEMATHSGILVWKNPMDREAWWTILHGVTLQPHGWDCICHYLPHTWHITRKGQRIQVFSVIIQWPCY